MKKKALIILPYPFNNTYYNQINKEVIKILKNTKSKENWQNNAFSSNEIEYAINLIQYGNIVESLLKNVQN